MFSLLAFVLTFGFSGSGEPPRAFEDRGHNPASYVQDGALHHRIEWKDGRLQRQDGLTLRRQLTTPLTVSVRVRVDPRPGAIGTVYLLDADKEADHNGSVKEVDLVETNHGHLQATAAIHSRRKGVSIVHKGVMGTGWRTVTARVSKSGRATIRWDGKIVARGHAGRGRYRLITNVWGRDADGSSDQGWAYRVPLGFTGGGEFHVDRLRIKSSR